MTPDSPRDAAQRVLDYHATKTTPLTDYEEDVDKSCRALVEIDKAIAPYAGATCGRTFANTLADKLASILDGGTTAEEQTP